MTTIAIRQTYKGKAVTVNGVAYPSRRACQQALEISETTLRRAIYAAEAAGDEKITIDLNQVALSRARCKRSKKVVAPSDVELSTWQQDAYIKQNMMHLLDMYSAGKVLKGYYPQLHTSLKEQYGQLQGEEVKKDVLALLKAHELGFLIDKEVA